MDIHPTKPNARDINTLQKILHQDKAIALNQDGVRFIITLASKNGVRFFKNHEPLLLCQTISQASKLVQMDNHAHRLLKINGYAQHLSPNSREIKELGQISVKIASDGAWQMLCEDALLVAQDDELIVAIEATLKDPYENW